MIILKDKPNILGTLASLLCLIHCLVTPFIFIAHTAKATCCEAPPVWWKVLDFFFLIISFYAVYWSTKVTAIKWIKPFLWISWAMLMIIILNEKLGLLPLPESLIYIPSISLVGLHLYNRKYCNCINNKCCVDEG